MSELTEVDRRISRRTANLHVGGITKISARTLTVILDALEAAERERDGARTEVVRLREALEEIQVTTQDESLEALCAIALARAALEPPK